MTSLNNITYHRFPPSPTKPISGRTSASVFLFPSKLSTKKTYMWVINSVKGDKEVVPRKKQEDPFVVNESATASGGGDGSGGGNDGDKKFGSKEINAAIVLGFGTLAVTRLLTIDHDYWHGWTLYEVLRYAPEHNWIAYEEALKTNPVLAKMAISGVVYSIGDWIAQCYEGKPLFEFDRIRMFRSGLVGFTLHGSLSHYYYQFCEALFPFQDWWVVPVKVAFDQTIWAAVWNSIYFAVLGLLRFESPNNILRELQATFWPMLTAGWKLWPFAHLITYGVIPVEQRLLWVDCVELIWVTVLSTWSVNVQTSAISFMVVITAYRTHYIFVFAKNAIWLLYTMKYPIHDMYQPLFDTLPKKKRKRRLKKKKLNEKAPCKAFRLRRPTTTRSSPKPTFRGLLCSNKFIF